jgi:hypothetical protein
LLVPELNSRVAYQLNSGFSILFDTERIGDIQATLSVLQQEECLVWSLCGASILRSQDDAQCIGTGKYNGFGQGLRGSEPNCDDMLAQYTFQNCSNNSNGFLLFLESAVDPSTLGLNCHGGISKAPS